jgi:FAD/FMN-containing dehydrogenase
MDLPEIEGRAVLPGDAGWDDARRTWNLAVDQRPAAVVEAAGPADIAALLRAGLRVAPQATGHGSELLGPLDDVVLLKTSRLKELKDVGGVVGAAAGPAGELIARPTAILRAGAGVLAREAADAAAEHGAAPVLGLATGVGVAGLVLGGGTGWLSRTHGLACNNVRAFDVVLASGETCRVDAGSEPDLFWALRGGGGRGAVVTAVELAAHPVEPHAGVLTWPAEKAAELLQRFREWTREAPEAVFAVFRYLALPTGPLAMIVAARIDGQPFSPMQEAMRRVGPEELVRVAGDPEDPMPTAGDGFLLRELDVDAIAAVIEDLAPAGLLEVRLLGGALAHAPEGCGAAGAIDAPYSVFYGGPASPGLPAKLAEIRERLSPYWAGDQPTASARGIDPARLFGASWERLRQVQRDYDPDGQIVTTNAA